MKSFDEIINEIKIVELKLLKYEPNSIMGVHWSSKLAGLKRDLSEVEMRDFEKWKSDYGLESEPNYSKETEYDCKAAYRAGQQSKQAEVDELQKRIDDALHEADESCGVSVDAFVKLNRILKGNSHES